MNGQTVFATTWDRADLVDLDRRLRQTGFRPGRPDRATASADELTCALLGCVRCQHQGLEYRPYMTASEDLAWRYRAIAACPVCGLADEL